MKTVPTRFRKLLGGKLQQDVLWNLVSLGLIGVGGIVLNVLIARFYDAATLGVFNQAFAAYILFSQFAVGGVHLSTVRNVAQHADRRDTCDTIISAAVLLTIGLAVLVTIIFWLSRPLVSRLLDSPDVAAAMAWATPGLFCFALNKTLLGVLNGLRRMRLYAVAQALRPTLMVLSLLVAVAAAFPGYRLAVVLSVAEVIITLLLLISLAPHLVRARVGPLGPWLRRHLDFGARSFGSGVLLELNTRIDVLMLGYFWSDALVGIYSFAAMLVEGIAQLPIVLRVNFNPLLARHLAESDEPALASLIRKGRRTAYAAIWSIAIVTTLAYPLGVSFVTSAEEFQASWPLFAVLMLGLALASGYLPFGQILLQAGRPGSHTLMTVAVVSFNIAANAALIPVWQAMGAACATAASFVVAALLLVIMTRRLVGVAL